MSLQSNLKPRLARLAPSDDSTATTWAYYYHNPASDCGSHFASPVLSAAFSSPRASSRSSDSFPSDNEDEDEDDGDDLDSAPVSRNSDRDEPEHSQLIMPSLTLPALPAASMSTASRSAPASGLNVALIAPDKYAQSLLVGVDVVDEIHSCFSVRHFSEPAAVLHAVEHLYFKADKLLLRRAPADTTLQQHWRSLVLHTLAGFDPVSAVFVVVDDEPPDVAAQADAWMQLSAMADVISVIPVLPVLPDSSNKSVPAHLDMSPSCLTAADLCLRSNSVLDNEVDQYLTLDQLKSLLAHHQEGDDDDALQALQSRAIANFTHWRHLAAPSLYKPTTSNGRHQASSSSSSLAAHSRTSSSASSVRSSTSSLRRSRQRSRRASTRPVRSALHDTSCGAAAAAAATDSTWLFSAHDPISFSLIAQMGRLLFSVARLHPSSSLAAEADSPDVKDTQEARSTDEGAGNGSSTSDRVQAALSYMISSDLGLLVYGGALAAAAVGMVAWLGRGAIAYFAH